MTAEVDHVEMCKALDLVDVLCEDADCHGYNDPRHEPRALRVVRLARDEHTAAWTKAEQLIESYGAKGAPSWDLGREDLIRKNVTRGLREIIKEGCQPEAPLQDLEPLILALLDEHAKARP